MSDMKMYGILGKFNNLNPEWKELDPKEAVKEPVYEAVEAKGDIMEAVKSLEEKYMGFKAVEKAAKKGGAENPAAVAASIGRKKYGKAKFQKAAAAGKKLGEAAKPDFLDLDKDGDTEEPMKQAAKQAKEHEPAAIDKDAVAKRKRLQALKDKQEDERAERGEHTTSASRVVKGRAYGGAAQKDAEDKDELDEKAVSKAQQKFMGMVHAVQKGKMKAPSKEVAKTAKGMTKKAAHDYAATKHKGLPQHVAEGKEAIRQHPIYTDKDAWDHYKKELDEQEAMEGVRNIQQELDEIASLAGVPVAKVCPACGKAGCKCDESMMDEKADLPSVNVETPLSHELSDAHCVVCNEAPCSCSHEEEIMDEAATRKDFEMVASLIKNLDNREKAKELAQHHADIFKKQNPRFDHARFCKACGLEECDWNMEPAMTPVAEDKCPACDCSPCKCDESMMEDEMEEGNEFSGALAKAKASGAKEFEVGGKKYTVKEDVTLNVSANGEEDVVNLVRKLAGMAEVHAEPVIAVGEETVEEDGPNIKNAKPRAVQNLNTPREEYAAADITTKGGTGHDRNKKTYRGEWPGDNPMDAYGRDGTQVKEEALWKKYEDMLNEITK